MYTGESQIERGDYGLSNCPQDLISEAKAQTTDLLLLLIFYFIYWFVETPASKDYVTTATVCLSSQLKSSFELLPEEIK